MPLLRHPVPSLAILLAAGAIAAEDVAAPAIIVEATRLDTPAFDLPVATNLVDARDLAELQPRTAAEALRWEPGIWVQKTGHIGGAPIIRGYIGNRVLYLFNGIRRNTGSIFSGPNSLLNDIDAQSIRRIEVIRGPGSVLYGSDAIGGVVNVISLRDPEDGLHGQLSGRYGSNDQERSGRAAAWGGEGSWFAAGGASRSVVSAPESGRSGGVMLPGGWDDTQFDGQASWRIGEHASLEVFGTRYERDHTLRYDQPTWESQASRQQYAARLRTTSDGLVASTTTTLYYQDQWSFTDQPTADSDSSDKTVGLDAQARLRLSPRLAVTTGVHAHRDESASSDPQNATRQPDSTWDNTAAFALAEAEVAPRLTLTAGLRLDQYTLTSTAPAVGELPAVIRQAVQNGTYSLADMEVDDTTRAVTGGIGAVVTASDSLNFYGNLANAFRAPNRSDILNWGQNTQGFGVPSPDVEPEHSWTWEIGAKWDHRLATGSLTYYETRLMNAVTSQNGTFNGLNYIDINNNGVQNNGEQVRVKSNSPDTVKGRGIEFGDTTWIPSDLTRAAVPGDLAVVANCTWSQVTGRAWNQSSQGSILPTPFNVLLGVRWENRRGAAYDHVWMQADWQGVRRFDDATGDDLSNDTAFRLDPQNRSGPLLRADGSIPGYGIANLRAGVDTRHGSLSLSIENVGNREYRQVWSRLDALGTNVVLAASTSF